MGRMGCYGKISTMNSPYQHIPVGHSVQPRHPVASKLLDIFLLGMLVAAWVTVIFS